MNRNYDSEAVNATCLRINEREHDVQEEIERKLKEKDRRLNRKVTLQAPN